jgi:CheY-like chemotaxis protein
VPTILVVDDEFGVADILAAALEDEGYRVITAANGKQGLEKLAQHRPDLVIVDYMMPVLDGPAMIRTMRADRSFEDVPVILMSSLAETVVKERLVDGYDSFIRKPFRLGPLLETVARTLKND